MKLILQKLGDIKVRVSSFAQLTIRQKMLALAVILSFAMLCFHYGCRDERKVLVRRMREIRDASARIDERNELTIRVSSLQALAALFESQHLVSEPAVLSITKCRLTQASLRPLQFIKVSAIDFVKCEFESNALDAVAHNVKVRALTFNGCKISPGDLLPLQASRACELNIELCETVPIETFQKWKPNFYITRLSLVFSGVTDDAVPGIVASFPNLAFCNLNDTGISEEGLMQFAAIPSLLEMYIPEKLGSTKAEQFAIMKRYNRRYLELHPDAKLLPFPRQGL